MGCNIGKEKEDIKDFAPFGDHKDLLKKNSIVSRATSKTDSAEEVPALDNLDEINEQSKYRTKVDSRVTAKYTIKALIGKGSFSDVLRVERKTTKEPFAVKVMKVTNPQEKELLDSELSVLQNLTKHPYIIKLQEVIIATKTTYLVIELATGGELYDKIKSRGYLDEKYACNITQMILDGLSYLHGIGITHRDLKPENLLFYHPGNDSKILITDFGFSKFNSEPSNFNPFSTWCGTPEYIAPELLSKVPYNYKVDMWAVGVIVYVMLSGHLPFSGNTTPRLFNQIIKGSYSYVRDVWDKISIEAKNFIDSLLNLDPDKRLDSFSALDHEWTTSHKPLHPMVTKKLLKPSKREEKQYKSNIYTEPPSKEVINAIINSAASIASDSTDSNKGTGLVLPVTGDFQAHISKEKILDDNASTMSPSNIDSVLATEDTDSMVSNLGVLSQMQQKYNLQSPLKLNYTFDNSIKLPVKIGDNKAKHKKSTSYKEQKMNFHEQFEVIEEESENELKNDNRFDTLKSDKTSSNNNTSYRDISINLPTNANPRSSYIEKVGVWLNEQDSENDNDPNMTSIELSSDIKNTSIPNSFNSNFTSMNGNSFKSNFTTSDQSHTSSFSRFLLPTYSQKQIERSTSSKTSIDLMMQKVSSSKNDAFSHSVSGYESDLYPGHSYTSSTVPLQPNEKNKY